MQKPSLFIGSSSEGIEFARAIRSRLSEDSEVTLWDEGFFRLGKTFIETLVESLPRFDFAVLVLTPDDWIHSRDEESFGPRDNVVFELGLFMGYLGRLRTFIVHHENFITKIPTDLAGVSTAQYSWPRKDENYLAAVGTACDSIRRVIKDIGFSEKKASQQIKVVAGEQKRQQGELEWMKTVVYLLVSDYERMHLDNFASDRPFMAKTYKNSSFEAELRRLATLNLIERLPGTGFRALFRDETEKNVKEHFRITERGYEYRRLYRQTNDNTN